MRLEFVKLQAAGNGYVAVDGRGLDLDGPALARWIGDPHFGVGSDGLLVACEPGAAELPPVPDAAAAVRIFNSDGSEAEMSGNGVRLFAKFVLDRGLAHVGADGLVVQTRAGRRVVAPRLRAGLMVGGRVAMGTPKLLEPSLRLTAAAREIELVTLSLGNPHAVLLTEEPVAAFALAQVGPAVEHHSVFPARTNFEVVNVEAPARLRVRVHERGEGETLSSGTGSTAAAVAARLAGRTEDRVTVCLPGGELTVTWPGSGEAFLEGPTEEVFRGEIDWPGQGDPTSR